MQNFQKEEQKVKLYLRTLNNFESLRKLDFPKCLKKFFEDLINNLYKLKQVHNQLYLALIVVNSNYSDIHLCMSTSTFLFIKKNKNDLF